MTGTATGIYRGKPVYSEWSDGEHRSRPVILDDLIDIKAVAMSLPGREPGGLLPTSPKTPQGWAMICRILMGESVVIEWSNGEPEAWKEGALH